MLRNQSKVVGKRLEEFEIRGRIEITKTIGLLRSAKTLKSPGFVSRFAVTQIPVKDHKLTFV